MPNQSGWVPLFKQEAKARNKSVSGLDRGGKKNPIVCCEDDHTIAKLHCSGRPDRQDDIWADFDEEWEWIDGRFDTELLERWDWLQSETGVRVLSIWLDVDRPNPSHRDFDSERDNFITITELDLKRLSTTAGTMHLDDVSFRNGTYELESKVRNVNDWDRVFA